MSDWYECASGKKTILPTDCSNDWTTFETIDECGGVSSFGIYTTICPEGYCADHDNECMRLCGSRLTYGGERFVYVIPCPGWDKCVRSGVPCKTKLNCTADRPSPCYRWQNMCMERGDYCRKCDEGRCGNGQCMSSGWRCDGIKQCNDGADENFCGGGCTEDQCGDGTCMETWWKCDGQKQCTDGTDEQNCVVPEVESSATLPLIIGGVAVGLILLVFILFCKYRWNKFTRQQSQSTSNSRRNPAVLVSGTSIQMTNRGATNASYAQPAPPYSSLQPSAPTQPQQTDFSSAPYPQQSYEGTSPYSQLTNGGASPYSAQNASSAPTAPPYPTAPGPTLPHPTAPGPTPPYPMNPDNDAPPSYETWVMGQSGRTG